MFANNPDLIDRIGRQLGDEDINQALFDELASPPGPVARPSSMDLLRSTLHPVMVIGGPRVGNPMDQLLGLAVMSILLRGLSPSTLGDGMVSQDEVDAEKAADAWASMIDGAVQHDPDHYSEPAAVFAGHGDGI